MLDDRTYQLLLDYTLGELNEADRKEVETLLEKNDEASSVIEELRQTTELLSHTLDTEPRETLTSGPCDRFSERARGSPAESWCAPGADR